MKRLLYLPFIFFLISCQEEVFINLDAVEPIPVIEAIWTDAVGANQVKITVSKDYYDQEPNTTIRNAEVFVRNMETGLRIPFRYSPQADRYLPAVNLGGTIGRTYELNVVIDGKRYLSTGTMLEPPTLDSITYKYNERRLFSDEGYYLTVFGDIPFTEDNNYRIRMIRNDTLLNSRNDYLLFDDTFGTSILNRGFELTGYPFKIGDNVRLELYRLNQPAFDYLNQLVSLLFNDGGLFSPPPQNPVSNIRSEDGTSEVLGYFMVSPQLTEMITIDPE